MVLDLRLNKDCGSRETAFSFLNLPKTNSVLRKERSTSKSKFVNLSLLCNKHKNNWKSI